MLGQSPRRPKDMPWVIDACEVQSSKNKDFMMGVVEREQDSCVPCDVNPIVLDLDPKLKVKNHGCKTECSEEDKEEPLKSAVVPVTSKPKKSSSAEPPHVSTQFSQAAFVESLQLVPRSKCKEDTSAKKELHLDCNLIDLTEDRTPRTPITPRSLNKSLSIISGGTSPCSAQRNLFGEEKEKDEEEDKEENSSDADSESSDEEVDEDHFKLRRVKKVLTAVDLVSPLGVLVRELVSQSSNSEPKIGSYEEYCGTDGGVSAGKLRERLGGFFTTFRKKRAAVGYHHKYCFNKRDKKDFRLRLVSGLNRESRRLVRLMKPCKLVLKNLTPEEVKKMSYVPRPKYRPRPRSFNFPGFLGANRSLQVPNLVSQLNLPRANPAAHLQPNAFQVYQQAQQQRQLHMQMMMAQKYPHLANNPAALQQRMLLNQRIMAAYTNKQKCPPQTVNGNNPIPFKGAFGKTQTVNGNNPIPFPGAFGQMPIPCGPVVPNSAFPGGRPAVKRKARPSKPKTVDDVISISSSEDEDEDSSSKRPCKDSQNRVPKSNSSTPKVPAPPATGLAANVDNQAVMFKCHLCDAEILFTQSTTMFIREHFAQSHGVSNVQILHNVDQNNQVTFSIIEGPPTNDRPSSQPRPKSHKSATPPQRPKPRPSTPAPRPAPAPCPDEVICID